MGTDSTTSYTEGATPAVPAQLSELVDDLRQRRPSGDADVDAVCRAYRFAEEHHRDQLRKSGEPYITHPLGCARIVTDLGMDDVSVIAALLHDTVEDTSAGLDDITEHFGETVSQIVDGVTKLSKIHFESTEEHQAENYRKLIVSMASDIRVLIVKLADRLHNMRTLAYMAKQKQIRIARETLDIYAPLAHRLGIHSLKWELEDLAFATLHPRRYGEIQQMVNQRRRDREDYIRDAGDQVKAELEGVGIEAQITGRAKHFYSIFEKMTRKGIEFNEIYDLTAMRVLVDSVKDCYGAVGIIHSLWKPMPGRFKDYIAVPKPNMYQSIHTTVVGPGGTPLEIQIRTHAMHQTAEYGVAAHWLYKGAGASDKEQGWLTRIVDLHRDNADPGEFLTDLRQHLAGDEVFVFTPRGELRNLPTGSTPIDFAYDVHTDVGHRCVGAKVNGRMVPLTYELRSGDFVEVLTSSKPRGPSRDWLSLVASSKARAKIRAFFRKEQREDAEHKGRETFQEHLRKAGLPSQRVAGSPLMLEVFKELGFRKAEEFYIAIGSGKTSAQMVVNRILQRLKEGEAVAEESVAVPTRGGLRSATAQPSTEMGIEVDGLNDVLVRLAKCCTPVPGDAIVGYISLGRGITIHRGDCPNALALQKHPERFTPVHWGGTHSHSFRVEIAVEAWDRPRLLEDISRAFGECGVNIVSAQIQMENNMVRDCFVVDVGDIDDLKSVISALRNVESVFDAYRVTPQ